MISEILVNGLVSNKYIYDGVISQMIDDNRDEEGNVIDADKDKEICEVLRQAIYKVGIPTKEVAIDYIIGYREQKNEVILKFIEITVRFINAVDKNNFNEYFPKWKEQFDKALKGVTGLHEVVVYNIGDWTHEYLKGVANGI